MKTEYTSSENELTAIIYNLAGNEYPYCVEVYDTEYGLPNNDYLTRVFFSHEVYANHYVETQLQIKI